MLAFWVCTWIVGILNACGGLLGGLIVLGLLATMGEHDVSEGEIVATLFGSVICLALAAANVTMACLCRTRPRLALQIFTWVFFIFLALNLTVLLAAPINGVLGLLCFIPGTPFLFYYFAQKDKMPN